MHVDAATNCDGTAFEWNVDVQRLVRFVLPKIKKIPVCAGALHANDQMIAVANRINTGIAMALLGKAAVPDNLPFATGSLGLLDKKPSWDLKKQCDTFVMVGSAFPYSEFLPKPGNGRGLQMTEGAKLPLRYPMGYNRVGDSKQTLAALLQ